MRIHGLNVAVEEVAYKAILKIHVIFNFPSFSVHELLLLDITTITTNT